MEDIVGDPSRCVLVVPGPGGPLLASLSCWSDGAALWMSTPAGSDVAAALRRRPPCAVYVPPATPAQRGTVVQGRGRVYGPDDLLGLALHGPAVSAAMTALALRNAPSLLASVRDAARVPWRSSWPNRVALKVAIHQLHGVDVPQPSPGVAPALPTEVPPEVRRALAGTRLAVIALGGDAPSAEVEGEQRLVVGPVVLGPGFAMAGLAALGTPGAEAVRGSAAGSGTDDGTSEQPAAVLLDASDAGRPPSSSVALVVHGQLRGDRLVPTRVTWWRGFQTATMAVSPRPAGSVVLPD